MAKWGITCCVCWWKHLSARANVFLVSNYIDFLTYIKFQISLIVWINVSPLHHNFSETQWEYNSWEWKNAGRKFHAAYIPQIRIVLIAFLISSEVHIWLPCTISETYAIKSQFKDKATTERFWIYIHRLFSDAFLCWRYACSMYFSIFSVLKFADSCKFFHGNMDTCTDS